MKTRFIASNTVCAILSVLLFSIVSTGAFTPKAYAQGRINKYTIQTSFSGEGEWNDLTESENATYIANQINYSDQDVETGQNVTTTLPFTFSFDNTTESSGTTLDVGPGWLSFGSKPVYQYYGGLASSTYPGMIDFFGGEYNMAGSGENNYPGFDATGYYGIYTEVDGVAPNRVFTIQWTGMHSGFGTGMAQEGSGPSSQYICSMQVKLYETTNVIQFFYQNHDQLLGVYAEYGPYYASSIGLNGFTSPSFTSLTYENDIANTPSTDLQFSPPTPPQELSLHSQGTALEYGTTNPQNPVTMCITAKSAGGAGSTLHITDATLTGSSFFSIVSGPEPGTAMPVGTSVQYCVQFLPFSDGNFSAIFTLATDGVDSGTQSISLFGNGAVPTVAYSATSMFRGVNTELTDTSSSQFLYVNAITPPGGGSLTVNSVYFIGPDAADYYVTHVPTSGIQPGGVDSIGVRFIPRIEGQPDAHMVIGTTATNIPWDTVSLYGVGILPHLAIDSDNSYPLPTTVNFDSVTLGTQSCLDVNLTNPGSDTIAIEKNYFQSADYDFSITPLTGRDTLIAPGGSAQIQVCFTPLQQGHREAVIRILTDIPHTQTDPPQDTSSFIVNIEGTGVPTGKLMLTASTKKDSSEIGTSVCQTDTLWNTGDAAITVTGVTITGTNAGDFKATLNTPTPFTLAANTSTTFQLCADPSVTGAETALLTATGTSSETTVTGILGLGVFGELIADTAVVSQAFLAESCGPDTEIVLVMNTGNRPATYVGSVPTNPNFTLLGSGNNGQTPGGGVDTFKVVFTPTSGPATGSLNIIGGVSPQTIALSATGGAAVITGSGNAPMTSPGLTSAAFPVTITNNGSCPWTPGAGQTVSDPTFVYQSGGTTPIAGSGGTTVEMFTYSPTQPGGDNGTVSFPNQVGTASSINVTITAATDDVTATSSNGFSLEQNYPNPFNQTSQFEITLPVACLVHLSIVDVEGQVVQTLLNQHYDAGSFEVSLDASGLASGTYYYQMTAGNVTLTKQMVILK